MPLANASLLDEARRAEAMTLMHRMNRRSKSSTLLFRRLSPANHIAHSDPSEPLGIQLFGQPDSLAQVDEAFGMLVQYPAPTGM